MYTAHKHTGNVTNVHVHAIVHVQRHTHTHTHTHKQTQALTCINFCTKVLKDAEEHLLLATKERSYYKSLVDSAKAVFKRTFTVDGELKPPCLNARLSPGTHNITMHYSFDMAQQVSVD